MKDLKSQLSVAFNTPVPEERVLRDSPDDPLSQGILAEGAHLDSDWMERLRVLTKSLADGPKLGDSRKLAHADQLTAQVMRALKKVARKQQARELGKLRKDWLGKRDKAAWSAIKLRFKEHSLSDKAYRSIKQQGGDPMIVLNRLAVANAEELQGLSAARLKNLLTG